MSNEPVHSTGRGGAGNIGHDPNTYVDADIVREGVAGQPGHLNGGDYSAGRGGAGNIVPSPRATPVDKGKSAVAPPPPQPPQQDSADAIPETAMRQQHPGYADFHTGRGGGGNIHKDKYGGHSTKREQEEAEAKKGEGFLEKARHAIGLGKKEGETS